MSNTIQIAQIRRAEHSNGCPTVQTHQPAVRNGFSRQEKCPQCLLTASQLSIPDERVRKGDFKPHVTLCRGRDSDGNPLGIEHTCLVTDCHATKTQRQTAAAWEQHYWRCHKIKLKDFPNLKSLLRHLQPWHAPDFEMNGDWGFFLTKKSPIQEFEHLNEYWLATSEPLKFRAKFQHQLVHDYRRDFTRIFQMTPISWHAHASDVWAALPSVVVLLEEDSPVPSRGLTQIQKDRCRLATFEAQMVAYHGPMV
jgi:hypothetical protein